MSPVLMCPSAAVPTFQSLVLPGLPAGAPVAVQPALPDSKPVLPWPRRDDDVVDEDAAALDDSSLA